MEELRQLIILIQHQFTQISNQWKRSSDYYAINMQTTRVDDVYNNEKLLSHIFDYRKFINDNVSGVIDEIIQEQHFLNVITTRVKAVNSIQFKIQNYELKPEQGKVALKKCLNDIFGIRMIIWDNINYEEIIKYIQINFPLLKCIWAKRKIIMQCICTLVMMIIINFSGNYNFGVKVMKKII